MKWTSSWIIIVWMQGEKCSTTVRPPWLGRAVIEKSKFSEPRKSVKFIFNHNLFLDSFLLLYIFHFLFLLVFLPLPFWPNFSIYYSCSVSWDSQIFRLHLSGEVRTHSPKECPGYDIKPSDSEAQVLELWKLWSTLSLLLLSGPLWLEVTVPLWVPSIVQIELLNHLLYLKQFNGV